MRLLDSHAHLGAPELALRVQDLLDRARAAGVVGVVVVGAGYGVGPNGVAVALAEEHRDVFATVGVHPHDAAEWGEIAEQAIDGWASAKEVCAIGECGLDYWYERSPRDVQRECLRAQIRLARAYHKPLVIHVRPSRDSRDAFDDILAIFDDEGADQCGGVIHCFTGDEPFARACLERDFDISFSGILTFKAADDLRDVARALPLERLMIETDSPLLAPVPHRGKRNEPALVVEVARCLAEVRGIAVDEIAECTTERACLRFGLELSPAPPRATMRKTAGGAAEEPRE
jgi:TatD DNase family protein